MQPPENPYSGFPGPNDPIPSYGTSGAASPAGVPNGGPVISFDVISQAWNVIKPNMGTYIGASLVILVIAGVFQGLQVALTPRGSNGQQEFSAIPLVLSLLGSLINQVLGAGLLRMAINNLKTGRPELGDVFSTVDVLVNLVIAGILVGICTLLGTCACIIPGLLLTGLFMFVNPLIVDRRMGAIEAMQTSFNTLKPQMVMAFVFLFVVGIITGLGVLACFVGLLVTIPLGVMSIAITYNNFFNNGNTPGFGDTSYPVAPIADPRF